MRGSLATAAWDAVRQRVLDVRGSLATAAWAEASKKRHTSRGATKRRRNDTRPRRDPTGSGVQVDTKAFAHAFVLLKKGALCNRAKARR